ncbi:MAG: Do family serine endopeptidase [Thermodesulfobacteriota bacterium]|nr:Do family serine endopeptidase [Thermodesulfobacteriota bacterium]
MKGRFWGHGSVNCLGLVFVAVVMVVSLGSEGWGGTHLRESPVVQAVKKVGPAVVNINSEYEITQRSNPFFGFGGDPFFDSFFRDFFEPRYERRYTGQSLGSGVIVDGKEGYILTNEHVIAGSTKVKVVLQDEREFDAELVGASPDFDLAILKIDSHGTLPAIEMGSSDDLMIGETVIAIGNPFGFSHTVTTGVISALERSVQAEDRTYRDFIQTDASINPGNSGGPILNIEGDLIGISTAIYSKAQGIGFAIPINKAKRVMDDLIKYGEIQIPWLGLSVQDLDRRLAYYFKIPEGQGVVVSDVTEGSPAYEGGLEPGQVLVAVGGRPVPSKATYLSIIREYGVGDVVALEVWKDGQSRVVKVRSKPFPEALAADLGYQFFGVRVQEITEALQRKFQVGTSEGVIISELRRGGYLERIGVRPGDVIRKINEVVVKKVDDYKRAVTRYRHKDAAVLVIQRGNDQYYVTMKVET